LAVAFVAPEWGQGVLSFFAPDKILAGDLSVDLWGFSVGG
jgi:hypothetical protein